MSTKNTTTKLHNPKSHAPAVYIPCWLIQVSIKLLSHAAKMTYGRLTQWASENGTVYRSVPQLSQELGCSEGSIEKYLKELKDAGLIGTFHPQAGGVNHFEFYDHPWMHDKIKEQLVYKQEKITPPPHLEVPPHDLTVPPPRSYGTPPPDLTDINIKEIEINNKQHISCKKVDSFDHEQQKNTPAENAVNSITPNEYQETLYPLTTSKSSKLSNTVLEQTNPHQIPAQMIQDWVETRKAKKSPVTPTVWNRLNKELSKCPNPIEAFEEMVCRGWLSFKSEWLQKGSHLASEQPFFDNKSTSWIDKLEQDVF